MTMPRSVADVLKNHVVFELECLDRRYLNGMVPRLQREQEVAVFFRFHRGHRFASSALREPRSKDFLARREQYAPPHRVPVVPFDPAPYQARQQEDIAQEFIARQGAKEGVMAALPLDYFGNRIKQYFKEGRAGRTETTLNHPKAFGLRKGLPSLPPWRQIGFQANRRLLNVQKISQDCALGEAAFEKVNPPSQVEERRVSGLRFGDGRVQALLSAVRRFGFVANGFSAKELRPKLAARLGLKADPLSAGRVTCDRRRLPLHGLIERLPRTHRYRLTERGIQIAAFWRRTYNRLLRPGLAQLAAPACEWPPLRRKLDALTHAIDQAVAEARIAA